MTRRAAPASRSYGSRTALVALALSGCFMRGYDAYLSDDPGDSPPTRPNGPRGVGPDALADASTPGTMQDADDVAVEPESDANPIPPRDAGPAMPDDAAPFDAQIASDAQVANMDGNTADSAQPPPVDAAGPRDASNGALDATSDAATLASCVGQGTCSPSCASGQTCELDCADAASCNPTCPAGAVCNIQCEQAGNCNVSCEGDASCRVDCSSNANCAVQCLDQAYCRKYCQSAGPCTMPSCTDIATSCFVTTQGIACRGSCDR